MKLSIDLSAQVGTLALRLQLETEGPLVLAGPNGAGKSTALLLLLGVLHPGSGRIALGDEMLFESGRVDLPPEQRRLGYVPQEYALFPHLDVLANVAFGLRGRERGSERADRAHALLASLEIAHLARKRPASLSGGERQRVALARALAPEPRALLLDEPLAALDATARKQVRGFLAERLLSLGLPALVVTHDPEDARALGPRIAVLEQGRLVQQGSLEELRAAPATPFVANFVLRT